ncbi:hypothetical protein EPD60_06595 [Flaviaesturariibacter flavus]|uniref:Capsule assembly Wzi family protein n=1 Tax=Flaviaesturariibacter flavus TaxID=2502780 RepID=A0A4R1BKU2_9BACT|nr:capsule assembly Wzi family protein [Flaviaesturariibacter flavus]TCJ17848.1 hypothetical protein EPD60_06595 [Flaviaesturariibacter flavus]
MQYKQRRGLALGAALLLAPVLASSQTTYLPQGAPEQILIERLEVKAQRDSVLNYSTVRPLSRKEFIPALLRQDSTQLSRVDRYNLYLAKINNLEWVPEDWTNYASRKPVLKNFYRTPATLFEVHEPNFFLAVNPVLQYTVSKEQDNEQHLFLNTRGATLRGRIADKIGFYAIVTDNQEREPGYVQQFIAERRAVPGAGFYKDFKAAGGVDYFDARGYVTFNAAKFIDISFGFDRNFIGAGYRSLFLSDFSAPTTFLRLNTRIWKFHYQNLFMELNSANRLNADKLQPKKYAVMHHLDLGVTKWLNVGLFEGVIFGRTNHFEFGYLNPVIFYRSLEQQNGSFDNSVAGIDFKANAAKHFQFYGQLLLDEFKLSEIKSNRGWWANKFGYQLGAKYIDAFNVRNLDLQLEVNRVRPFTYSHNDSVANYTHYNQPLAHPLGANFQEVIGTVRYQPAPKWLLLAKAMYYYQGRDTGLVSFGGNIFLPNQVPDPADPVRNSIPHRTADYGYYVGSGLRNKVAMASLLVSYQLRPNLFFELNGAYRRQSVNVAGVSDASTFIFTGGVRWNIHRRDFDF